MNAIGRSLVAAIVLLPGVCYGQLTWGFEDSGSLPGGWAAGNSADGYWSLAASQFPVGTGKVLRAVLNPPSGSSGIGDQGGAGVGGAEVNIDTYSPEFRFQNLASAELNFNFDISATDGQNFLDALQVALVDRNLQPVAELWQYQDRFGAPFPLPIGINDPAEGNYRPSPAQHTDGVTVYRVRLRVYDGDTQLTSFNGAEVDNMILTSAILNTDYNRNGTVDASDYVVWRKTYGSTSNRMADGDGDATIDPGDYTKWRTEFGVAAVAQAGPSSAEGAASGTVPEPCLLEILPIIVIGLAMDRRAVQWFVRRENPLRGRLDWGYLDR